MPQSMEKQTQLLRPEDSGAGAMAESSSAVLHLTPMQMKRVRDTCQAQSQLITAMQRKLSVLEATVAQEAA